MADRVVKRGSRVNTISPGIIFTPLAKDELASPRGDGYRRMMTLSAAGRGGMPDEVGVVGALLMGPDGAFITGSDILMDGGESRLPTGKASSRRSDRRARAEVIEGLAPWGFARSNCAKSSFILGAEASTSSRGRSPSPWTSPPTGARLQDEHDLRPIGTPSRHRHLHQIDQRACPT